MNTATEKISRPMELLLVEDNPGDVRLTQEAFHDANSTLHRHVVTDGAEAMALLQREGRHAAAPRPDLILLDLNVPKLDGREVLARIKEDGSLKTIPTVVLTTSQAEVDIKNSYQLDANSFLTKPVEFGEFAGVVRSINEYWLEKARLPQFPSGE